MALTAGLLSREGHGHMAQGEQRERARARARACERDRKREGEKEEEGPNSKAAPLCRVELAVERRSFALSDPDVWSRKRLGSRRAAPGLGWDQIEEVVAEDVLLREAGTAGHVGQVEKRRVPLEASGAGDGYRVVLGPDAEVVEDPHLPDGLVVHGVERIPHEHERPSGRRLG